MVELHVGDEAPDFTADSTRGKLSLKDFRGKKVVLYFYPKDDTPGCTTEACEFSGALKTFENAGMVVLGVSKSYGVYGPKKFMGVTYKGISRTTFLIDENGRIARIFANVKPKGHAKELLNA